MDAQQADYSDEAIDSDMQKLIEHGVFVPRLNEYVERQFEAGWFRGQIVNVDEPRSKKAQRFTIAYDDGDTDRFSTADARKLIKKGHSRVVGKDKGDSMQLAAGSDGDCDTWRRMLTYCGVPLPNSFKYLSRQTSRCSSLRHSPSQVTYVRCSHAEPSVVSSSAALLVAREESRARLCSTLACEADGRRSR